MREDTISPMLLTSHRSSRCPMLSHARPLHGVLRGGVTRSLIARTIAELRSRWKGAAGRNTQVDFSA